MLLLIVYLLLALVISFLCSIMEAVLLTTPQSFIVVKLEAGKGWAKSFNQYKNNIDKPLSGILSLNTIAHTIGAAGVGAQAIKVFGEAYFGIVSAVLTILILIITEIIPKTIGATYWRKLTGSTALLIKITLFVTYPLVVLSSLITKLISNRNSELSTSREEIAALASIGAEEGVFSESEDKILQNLLKLKDVQAKKIMTPRVVVAIADENESLNAFLENKGYLNFTRIPVYANNDENITGYVIREHVFENIAEQNIDIKLKDIKRPIIVVPNSITLFSIWEKLIENKEHIALVVDEYGGMDGIVTMEDIIETMLGLEIVDEKDLVTDMQEYARRKWKIKQARYNLLDKQQKKNK